MTDTAQVLESLVNGAAPLLKTASPDAIDARRPAGAWTGREILGHLIDSAANNHHRFVRSRDGDLLDFPAYDQRAWVESQRYDECDWAELVGLWQAYNRHLVHVLRVMPESQLSRLCRVSDDGSRPPQPIAEVARSYVTHLRHHLSQLIDV